MLHHRRLRFLLESRKSHRQDPHRASRLSRSFLLAALLAALALPAAARLPAPADRRSGAPDS